tara:strand:+ start:89 stop:1024 length:936 start_codon:yes stop_codon:yes gene_type:complete
LIRKNSQLSFWHGNPEINFIDDINNPKPYYMKFYYKADYNGIFDDDGIPLLNYHGSIGKQYNPIAIAQYGLGNYNFYLNEGDVSRKNKFLIVANWLKDNLEPNEFGLHVWMHKFDFEYKEMLVSPWYSGLAQGLGLSVLIRAYLESNNEEYLIAYDLAKVSLRKNINEGGVIFTDNKGHCWIEEYILKGKSPTHILNGFIWALWGVHDAWRLLNCEKSKLLFHNCIKTIKNNINQFDLGYWSSYDISNLVMRNPSSLFYHRLHIVQLKIMYNLTGEEVFDYYAKKWNDYLNIPINRQKALIKKVLFKIAYY